MKNTCLQRWWTASEDRLFQSLTNAQIAARTGRSLHAVCDRRKRLRKTSEVPRQVEITRERKAEELRDSVNVITAGDNSNLAATLPEFRATNGWTTSELHTLVKVLSGQEPLTALNRSKQCIYSKADRILQQQFSRSVIVQPILP